MAMTNKEIEYYANIHRDATSDFTQICSVCEAILACKPYQWSVDYMLTLNCVGIIFFTFKTDENETNDILTRLSKLQLTYEYEYKINGGGISVEFKENPLGTFVESAI